MPLFGQKGRKTNILIEWPKKGSWGGTACSHYQELAIFIKNKNNNDGLFTYLLSCLLALLLLVTNHIY
jgi:hypothetical protein